MARTGSSLGDAAAAPTPPVAAHSFPVADVRLFGASIGGTRAELTTSARDGKLVWWTREEIAASMDAWVAHGE